jgi:hypothetical protein
MENDQTRSHINEFGWTVIMIEATDYLPSFAYSIGLWETHRHPEVICFGLNINTLHGCINDVGNIVKSGKSIEIGRCYDDFFESVGTQFVPVHDSYIPNYFGYAMEHYNYAEFPAIQLIWTDRNHKFPWEPDFEEGYVNRQPLLDRNIDFKFREEKNLGVFTTRQWLEKNKPILRVVHDLDGDWQFLTGDQILSDARIVALEELTKKDITLNEVFDLDYGRAAERNFVGDFWRRQICENDD